MISKIPGRSVTGPAAMDDGKEFYRRSIHYTINTNQKTTALQKRRSLRFLWPLSTLHSPVLCASSLLHPRSREPSLFSVCWTGRLVPADPAPRLRTTSSRVNALAVAADSLQTWPVTGISHPALPNGAEHYPASPKHVRPPAVGVAREPMRAASEQLTPRNPAQEGAAQSNQAEGGTRPELRPAPDPSLPLARVPVGQLGTGPRLFLRYLCACGAGPR